MILRLDGSLVEREVARAYEGDGVWLVRQDREGFAAVHQEGEREEVLGRYESFEEAHRAASEAADAAFLAFLDTWEVDPRWDGLTPVHRAVDPLTGRREAVHRAEPWVPF